jgi:Protein of unknown function (DUF3500)
MRMRRRTLLTGAALLAAGSGLVMPAIVRARDPMADAALAFLESIGPGRHDAAVFPFDGDERTDWHYVPRARVGVPLKDLKPEQRDLVFALLRTALSDQGMRKVEGVIQLEGILGEITGNSGFRDPENYALAIFGDPSDTKPWGWRFEGHHLSLSFTVAPGAGYAVTPAFLGANPAEVRGGHRHAGLRVLKREHDLAFQIVGGLSDSQRKTAILQPRSFDDILTGPGREDSLRQPQGLVLAAMDSVQRGQVFDLVEAYVRNMRAAVIERELRDLRAAGPEKLHFAWAGGTLPDEPHYYRLHGPTLIIEYDNTQNGGNHAHSVWHDPRDGLGRDLLRRHHENDHKRG